MEEDKDRAVAVEEGTISTIDILITLTSSSNSSGSNRPNPSAKQY